MGPHAAVAPPASSITAATPIAFWRRGCMPNEAATSSPSWRRLSPGVLAAARSMPSRRNGRICQNTDMSRPATEPTTQNR